MDGVKLKNYNISKHAQERYVERIMKYDNQSQIRYYISNNSDKIKEYINKLVNYGELIYEGRIKQYNISQIFLNGSWVIHVDKQRNTVITIYKIELGDDEVNKMFIDKMMNRINDKKVEIIHEEETTNALIEHYQDAIDVNNHEIDHLEARLKTLHENNSSYNTLIKNANQNVSNKKQELSDLVYILIGRKEF